MTESTSPENEEGTGSGGGDTQAPQLPALVVAWSRDEPWRVGEVVTVPPGVSVAIGRGAADGPPDGPFGRHRPGVWLPSPPLRSRAISRRQLTVRALDARRLHVVNEGRCALLYRGKSVDEAECAPGDLLQLGQQLLLLCTQRPDRLPGDPDFAARFEPGEPDPHGMVGESPAMWALRARIAEAAARGGPALVTGPPGAGKDLAARALAVAPKARGWQGGLSVPRMEPAREYGDRLLAGAVAAPAGAAPFSVPVPGLDERREDVPLLIEHFVRAAAGRGDPAALQLFSGEGPGGRARLPLPLVRTLVGHAYTTHVRELEAIVQQLLARPLAPSLAAPADADGGAVAEWASSDDSSAVSSPHALEMRRRPT